MNVIISPRSIFVKVQFVTLKIKTQQAHLILFQISVFLLSSFLLINFNINSPFLIVLGVNTSRNNYNLESACKSYHFVFLRLVEKGEMSEDGSPEPGGMGGNLISWFLLQCRYAGWASDGKGMFIGFAGGKTWVPVLVHLSAVWHWIHY